MVSTSEITVNYIQNMWKRLEPAFEVEWNRMELVEAWRSLDKTRLESEIWAGVPEGDRGKILIVKNTVSSVLSSAIALSTTADEDLTVRMRNSVSPASEQDANFNRRAVTNMQKEINQYRTKPFEYEVKEMVYARGAGIVKYGLLDVEQRGEVREPITDDLAPELTPERIIENEDGSKEFIVNEGDFPGYFEVLDPLDCVYIIGPGKRGLKIFIHAYYAEAYDILAAYPDAQKKGLLTGTGPFDEHGSSAAVRVMEYWDDENMAVVINDEFYYEPTPHNLDQIPIQVERVNEQSLRTWSEKYANGLIGRMQAPVVKVVTPFAWPMIDDVTKASFAESLLASKLPEMANTPIIHQGISTGDAGSPASPYFKRVKTSDGRVSRLPRYRFIGDKSSGGRPIWPLFERETMMPLNPTPIADHLAIFMQQRNADLEISGMNAELLSGRIRSEPSGISVNQQIQLTSSRMNPYNFSATRLISKGYTGLFRSLAASWDRGTAPLILASLNDEPDVQLEREMIDNIVEIIYTTKNIFPRDAEAEKQAAFQAHAQGAMPLRNLIKIVDSKADPQEWLKQIAWEMMVFQDPQQTFLRAIAAERQKELGFGDIGASPDAQQAAQQQAQLAGAATPPVGGQPPPQQNGGAPAGLPPELMALLQGAGPPQGGQ